MFRSIEIWANYIRISSNYTSMIKFEFKVEVRVPFRLPKLKSRDVVCIIGKSHLTVGLKNQPPIIDSDFPKEIKVKT